jgi:hypothetical protein
MVWHVVSIEISSLSESRLITDMFLPSLALILILKYILVIQNVLQKYTRLYSRWYCVCLGLAKDVAKYQQIVIDITVLNIYMNILCKHLDVMSLLDIQKLLFYYLGLYLK